MADDEYDYSVIYGSLENFEIQEKIGRGQFSEVYRAKCKIDGALLALKKVIVFKMLDPKDRQALVKEIDLLKELNHPAVNKYYASFVEGNNLNIVLELADGGDLSRLINQFKMQNLLIPERTIWKYFVQLCEAIEHLHTKQIIHRDVRPSNVFITAQGEVKLGGLGLALHINAITVTDSPVGTPYPYYMSPEHIHGDGCFVYKSDIWSIGCLLYEMAALRVPFYDEKMNVSSLYKKIESCEYPPLSSDIYSKDMGKLVSSCINLAPSARPDIGKVATIARAMHAKCSAAAPAQSKPILLQIASVAIAEGEAGSGTNAGKKRKKFKRQSTVPF